MKKPKSPPEFSQLWESFMADPSRLDRLFRKIPELGHSDSYLHWDKVRYLEPPLSLTSEEWWFTLKLQRRSSYKKMPLYDRRHTPFVISPESNPIPERLHDIDLGAGGQIQMSDQITNPETRDQYFISSLIQEAITSSQLEGAATTRQVAKEMIKSGRKPVDRSEQMILNNFKTMQHISELKNETLSSAMLFEIHRLVTENTLDDESAAGRFRRADEDVHVVDMYDEILHTPPPAAELGERLDLMCRFANSSTESGYIHPVIRSIILHFWLAYDHPFVDGNGRTARALFYWSMLRHGYWLFEFISISQILLKAPVQYERAFLYTETDDNDLTYFVIYHLEVIRKAIEQLHVYIRRKTERLRHLEGELRGMAVLNHRQRALIGHALRHPYHLYTVQSHRISHNIVYETARNDLQKLESLGLLLGMKVGKKRQYSPAPELEKKLLNLG